MSSGDSHSISLLKSILPHVAMTKSQSKIACSILLKILQLSIYLCPLRAIFFASKEKISHFGETILNSLTSKLEHNLAILPTFIGPFGSTNTTFKLSLFFFKFITSYVNTLIN